MRKTPVKHRVKAHKREDTKVDSYVRGSGAKKTNIADPSIDKKKESYGIGDKVKVEIGKNRIIYGWVRGWTFDRFTGMGYRGYDPMGMLGAKVLSIIVEFTFKNLRGGTSTVNCYVPLNKITKVGGRYDDISRLRVAINTDTVMNTPVKSFENTMRIIEKDSHYDRDEFGSRVRGR